MRLWHPRSLTDLMLIGFALVAVPLLFAVIVSATKVRGLANESAALVRTGVESTHLSQQLYQNLSTMERNARLYQVLKDESYLNVYDSARQRLDATLQSVRATAVSNNAITDQVARMQTTDAALSELVHGRGNNDLVDETFVGF